MSNAISLCTQVSPGNDSQPSIGLFGSLIPIFLPFFSVRVLELDETTVVGIAAGPARERWYTARNGRAVGPWQTWRECNASVSGVSLRPTTYISFT